MDENSCSFSFSDRHHVSDSFCPSLKLTDIIASEKKVASDAGFGNFHVEATINFDLLGWKPPSRENKTGTQLLRLGLPFIICYVASYMLVTMGRWSQVGSVIRVVFR